MSTIIVKTNASQATDVLIKDVGILIPNSGGSETFDTEDDVSIILRLVASENLRTYLTDNAYGAGSSTLILNDGTSDIAQADAELFLDMVLVNDASVTFGAVKLNSADQISTSLTFNGTATVSSLKLGTNLNANSFKITSLLDPTSPQDAATKYYVDQFATAGRVWKEVLLAANQLDSTNNSISQAIPFYLDGQPSISDTFIITDGTTTETFIFKAAESIAFDVAIGGSTDATMTNLAQAINDDSTLWDASLETTLQTINDGSGLSTAGRVIVIFRTNQSATSFTDRIYGVLTTQAFGQLVNYNAELDYNKSTSSTLGTSDPAVKQFGIGRVTASLYENETHLTRDEDAIYTWDSDTTTWQNTGTSSIIAGAGLTKTGNTIDVVAANASITVNANSIETTFGSVTGIGAANANGTNASSARSDHVHAHGDRGADGAVSEHDAQQVDVTGAYTDIGSPAQVETALSNINSNFANTKYIGKILDFGSTAKVPNGGTLYLGGPGNTVSSAVPFRMLATGTFTRASIVVDAAEASNVYKLSIQVATTIGGTYTEVSLVSLTATNQSAVDLALTGAFSVGNFVRVALIRTSGSGNSTFNNISALVEYKET